MIIDTGTLSALFIGFQGAFIKGLEAAKPQWDAVAMKVTSGTSEEEYGFAHTFSGIREWLGDRVVNNLGLHGFKIVNRSFEHTIAVPRDKIADDRFNVFAPALQQLGADTALFPDTLVFPLLPSGFSATCYDGQFFFDTDHPVIDSDGAAQSVSNTGGGAGDPWFVIDSTKAFKPLIYQERQPFAFARRDQPTDENVFMRKEYLYGVDGRSNVGFGLWQLAYGSKQTLDAANYAAARAAMMAFTRDGGTKLGIMPDTLIVGPSLEQAARQLLFGGDRIESPAGGVYVARSNEWANSARLVVTPYL